MTSLENLC